MIPIKKEGAEIPSNTYKNGGCIEPGILLYSSYNAQWNAGQHSDDHGSQCQKQSTGKSFH